MIDTSLYYHIAYVVAGVIYVLYTLSLWQRSRRVRARLHAIEGTRAEP